MSQSNAAGPERARGAATVVPNPAKPVFPFAPDEAAAFDNPSPSESGRTDTRNPRGRTYDGKLKLRLSVEPGKGRCVSQRTAFPPKKMTLCFNLQTIERMEENFNTGSRKHDVSNSASLSQPACCSRGQVQREFINSFMSVANYGPLAQEKKVLCYQSRRIHFHPSAGCVAPRGVAQ